MFARIAIAALCVGLVLAAWPDSQAPAAFPGQNGKIAFASERDGLDDQEVFSMNANGSAQTNLTQLEPGTDAQPAWSPNGQQIAFFSNRDGQSEIYAMNADGSGQTNLTNNAGEDFDPVWSPDGQKIAFQSTRDGNGEVYVMNADGSAQANLTNNAANDGGPVWSPDGTKIAFHSDRDGNLEVYSMNADGSGQTRLTTDAAADQFADWSPDGQKLAFESTRDGQLEIYSMQANGSSQTRLTTDPATDNSPAWSPDGQKIAFSSARAGSPEIFVMNADGTTPTNLTNDPGADREPNWAPGSGCSDVQVGLAVAQGCFTETAQGSGIFETDQRAWVGGFEILPRPGGTLLLNTSTPAVSASGAGVDMIFAGFAVPIPVAALPVNTAEAAVQFGGGAGTVAEILKVPVEASVKVKWTDGGRSASYEQKVAIKRLTEPIGPMVTPPGTVLGDFGGSLTAKLENGVGFVLQQGELRIDKVTLLPDKLRIPRKLELRDLLLRFELKDKKPFWTGRGGFTLPLGRGDLGFTGTVFMFEGSLAGGGLAIDGINKRLGGTPLFLQSVSGDLLFAPRFGHDLGIKGSLGPRVRGKQLLTLSGQMKGGELITRSDCPSGDDPEKLLVSSKLTPLEPLELAGLASSTMSLRSCVYPYAGLVPAMDMTATVAIEFAGGALGYEASQTGFISNRGANLEGAAQLTIPVPGLSGTTVGDSSVLSGSSIVSTRGTAACASVGFFEGGFGHQWGSGAPSAFSGCDLAPFRVTARPRALRASASASPGAIEVPKGLPHAGFAATGAGGPPLVRVSGPGGFELSSPADGSVLRRSGAMIASVAEENTTYVFVRNPRAGSWRVQSADPANPLTAVRFARGLPKPKVTARVRKLASRTGKGGRAKPKNEARLSRRRGRGATKRFRLSYRVRPIAGQRVVFTERGAGIARKLGKAKGRRGTITFKPTLAANRKRRIEVEVIQNGLPREILTVARFKAPPRPKLRKPEVEAKRNKASLKLSWPKIGGAANYLAEVKAGSEVLYRVLTAKRKLRFDGTPAKGKLKVTVQALSKVQPPGPTAKLTVKPGRKR